MVATFVMKLLPPKHWRTHYAFLAPFLRKHRSAYVGLLLLTVLDIALTLAFAWFFGTIADAAVQGRFDRLRWLVPLGVGLAVLSVSLAYANRLLSFRATVHVKKDVKEAMLHRLLRLPAHRVGQLRSGAVMTHFTDDLHGIDGMIGGSLIQLVKLPLVFLAVFLYMTQIHGILALLGIAVLPVAIGSGAWFGAKLRANNRRMHDLAENANSLLNETLLGALTVRAFTLERTLHRKFAEENSRLFALETKDTKLRGWFAAGSELAGAAAFLGSLCAGAYFVTAGVITIGSLVTFVSLTQHLVYPVLGMGGLWAGFQSSLTSLERIRALVERAPEAGDLPDFEPPAFGSPIDIDFEDVTFAYEENRPVFESLRLRIPAGSHVAIVGPSGAGKTTLFNLLLGFYRPQKGSIRLGGCPLEALSDARLRSSIAYVSQEPFLFSGTVRDNLALARPGRTEEDMYDAARKAQLHDFILSLPNGYDTEIGERGVKLSGGQKQRLAIARAILKDAPVLLLDEATSSLDSETEHEVQQALSSLMSRRTTISIAHRLSTVRSADMIVVLQNGRIVQTGAHEELLSMPGLYQDLFRKQHFIRRSHAS